MLAGANVFNSDPATVYYYSVTGGWSATYGGLPTVAINNYNGLQISLLAGAVTITNYIGSGGAVAIPNTIYGYPVTSIGNDAFYYCTTLTSITIPNSVTNIGNGAFDSCFHLTSVTMLNGVTSIGSGAFSDCFDLANITIPNGVTSIGSGAFQGTALTSITIPNSVTSIGEYAFQGDERLTNITFVGNAPALGGGNVFNADSANVYYYYGTSGWSAIYDGLPTSRLTWMPPVGNASMQSGGFRFSFVNPNGLPVVIEASTNLVNWQPVWTNSTSGGFFNATNFTDMQWANYRNRYYRAR